MNVKCEFLKLKKNFHLGYIENISSNGYILENILSNGYIHPSPLTLGCVLHL